MHAQDTAIVRPPPGHAPLFVRNARPTDEAFLVEAIVAAERSGTSASVYERVLGIDDPTLRSAIRSALRENLPGCELHVGSFLVATIDGAPVGCLGRWIRGRVGQPSSFVRALLMANTLGACWTAAAPRLALVAGADLRREPGALQIESVYVRPDHRGSRFTARLIEAALSCASAEHPSLRRAQILSMIGNERSGRAFAGAGFRVARTSPVLDAGLRSLLPGDGRMLWERDLAEPAPRAR